MNRQSEPKATSTGYTVRRASLVLLLGSSAGFGIGFALTPVIARLYTPDVYGLFVTISAAAAVFVGVSTFRLEVQSLKVRDNTEAERLAQVATLSALGWSALLTAGAVAMVAATDVSGWWAGAGVLVFAASLQLVGATVLTRHAQYKQLSLSNFIQGAGTGLLQAGFGWLAGSVGLLMAGFTAARLAWLRFIPLTRQPGPSLITTFHQHRHFALVSGTSAIINSLAGQLPILLTALLFGQTQVGYLGMALRLLVAPLAIAGQAAASANVGEVSRLMREYDSGSTRMILKGMRDLLLTGLVPCLAAGTLGVWAVPLVLGPEWRSAGVLMACLSVGALAQFVVSPFSQLILLADRARQLLRWDIGRLAATAVSFIAPTAAGAGPVVAVAMYSLTQVALYLWMASMCLKAVRDDAYANQERSHV